MELIKRIGRGLLVLNVFSLVTLVVAFLVIDINHYEISEDLFPQLWSVLGVSFLICVIMVCMDNFVDWYDDIVYFIKYGS